MYHSQKKRNLKLARICTYNWLIGFKFLSDIEHEQHEPNKTKQLFAHCGPWHRGRGCIHAIPDVHVKIPVHLEKQAKKLWSCYNSDFTHDCVKTFSSS